MATIHSNQIQNATDFNGPLVDGYFLQYVAASKTFELAEVSTGEVEPTFWIEADQIPGISDNDPLGTWPDLAETPHDVSATGSARPTWKADQVNGLPAVDFDGVNDLMSGDSFLVGDTGSIFAICKRRDASNLGLLFTEESLNESDGVLEFHFTPTFNYLDFDYFNLAGDYDAVRSPAVSLDWHLVEIHADGTLWRMFVDGEEQSLTVGAGSNSGKWASSAPNRITSSIGGWKQGGGVTFDGQIAAVKIFDDIVLTDAQKLVERTRLMFKYGLFQAKSEKGQANGYASLDSGGTVPDAQIPSTIARDAEVAASYQPLDATLTALSGKSSTGTGNIVLASDPALTGVPTAPTAAGGTNTTQIASTAFVTSAVSTAVTGTLKFMGATDCSTNPNYPAASKGDVYVVSVAGKIGGASGASVDVGDEFFATADNAGGTQAAVGSSWAILEHNLQGAVLAANNGSDFANAATTVNNLGGAASTGSGGLVRTTSPTLVTPNLGTPSALVATNATGTASGLTAGNVTTNANLTGPITSVGNATTITDDAVTYAKMQNVSATDKLLGRASSGAGDVEEIALTAAGRALIDDADAAAQRTTLGVPAGSGTSTNTNTGDQVIPTICNGRLTTETGVAVSTSDRTAQGTIYWTAYNGNQISLYDGSSAWNIRTFSSDISLALTVTSGKNYDVFVYDNATVPTLELSAAWTNGTTRADALTTQNGIIVKSGATTRRWVGTIRASGTNVTEDSGFFTQSASAKRFVWNAYNQVFRPLWINETTSSWTYTTLTYRQTRASANNQLEVVCGSAQSIVVNIFQRSSNTLAAVNRYSGVGLNSTTTLAATYSSVNAGDATNSGANPTSGTAGYLPIANGYSYLAQLEQSVASGTTTWNGGVNHAFGGQWLC